MASRTSPGRMPAADAGESAETFQASIPVALSDQATPSSTRSYRERWTKLSQAKTTAARVARAKTTAPTRTRRFSFMAAVLTITPFPSAIAQQLSFQSLVDIAKLKYLRICNLRDVAGYTTNCVQFLVG